MKSVGSIGRLFVDNLFLYGGEINRFVITVYGCLSLLGLLPASY